MIDNRSNFFPADQQTYIQQLCARRTGIGADGVILLENSVHSDFRMRIFNADGKEAEMCGNGIRCLMKFIQERGFTHQHCMVETFLRPLAVSIADDLVTVNMGAPFDFRWDLPLMIDNASYIVHHLNTGVPHLILFTDALDEFPIEALGPKFRHHKHFDPKGANLNAVQLMPNGELWNRTFERGVESETLACGTGCAAAAIVASKIYGLLPPIKVRARSNELLEISFTMDKDMVRDLKMTGPATKTFSGSCKLLNFTVEQTEFA